MADFLHFPTFLAYDLRSFLTRHFVPLSGIPYTYKNIGQAKLFSKSQKKILLYTLGIWYTISKISSISGGVSSLLNEASKQTNQTKRLLFWD